MDSNKSRLGLFSIVLLGINTIIGTGIYLLPAKPMALVGPSSILLYVLVTFIVLAIALCFAECATFFTRNGAAYLYAKEAFGDFAGYQVGVLKCVVSIIAWAAFATGFVIILGEIWPLANKEPYRSSITALLIGGFGGLNLLGIKHVKIINNIVAITKLTPLFFFIVLGLFYMDTENFFPFVPVNMEFGHIGEASLIIFFAFSGFETLAVAAEEMHNPQRNIPLAIVIVLTIAALIYLLIQLVVVGVLGSDLVTSVTPIADAANKFFGVNGRLFILFSTLISSVGINIAASFTTPKTIQVLAKDGLMPKALAKTNFFGSPSRAIIVSVILTIIAALSGTFMKLAAISVVARLCQFIPTCLAVFVLRKKQAPEKSFFPKSLELATPALGILFTVWLLANASTDELLWGAGTMVISAPFYFIIKKESLIILSSEKAKA